MPIPHARRMNLIALALLITALVALVAFHLLPVESYGSPDFEDLGPEEVQAGWGIWLEFVHFLKGKEFDDIQSMIGFSSFLTSVVLIIACPILVPILRQSHLVWWLATICSGFVLAGLGIILVINNLKPGDHPGPAVFSLLASLALNFLGLLFIRREVPAAPVVDP